MPVPLSLYIHIPFCAAKCAYCDFASWSGKEDAWAEYIRALEGEMAYWKDVIKPSDGKLLMEDYEIISLFIGGGTPSILPPEMIKQVLRSAKTIAPFADDAEITMEANPGTLTMEKLMACKQGGVNRLSFGAQSFDEQMLRMLGRIHSAREIEEAVTMARAAGFENINLDLMYALPGQTMDIWKDTLNRAAALGVEHISAYSLIVEDGTPMARRVESGEAVIPEDDEVNAMQRYCVEYLREAGYGRYEISNYAKAGKQCRHNLVYWNRDEYLGLGCAAHSLLKGRRFSNPVELNAYMGGVRYEDEQILTREDAMEETVMLATRTVKGLDLSAWQEAFGEDFIETRKRELARLENAGMVEIRDGFISLTTRGMEVQSAIVVDLLD